MFLLILLPPPPPQVVNKHKIYIFIASTPMFLGILIAFIFCVCAIVRLCLRRKSKLVRFVGPRGTGKTKLLNFLTSVPYKTVPTLERYKVEYRNCVIEDVPVGDGDGLDKFSIDDPNWEYFFFVSNLDDYRNFIDTFSTVLEIYKLKFVIVEGCENVKEKNLICLNGDSNSLKAFL